MIDMNGDAGVSFTGLYNPQVEAYDNNASVSGQLLTSDGLTLLCSFSMINVDNSNGDYFGVVPHSVTSGLTQCTEYMIRVTAISGGLTTGRQWIEKANIRGES